MTPRAVLHVRESAAASWVGGHTRPVIVDREHQHLTGDLDTDVDHMGAGVPGHVGQRLPDHGQQVGAQVTVDHGVDGTGDRQLRPHAEWFGGLLEQMLEQAARSVTGRSLACSE